jgi:hypothetical protein
MKKVKKVDANVVIEDTSELFLASQHNQPLPYIVISLRKGEQESIFIECSVVKASAWVYKVYHLASDVQQYIPADLKHYVTFFPPDDMIEILAIKVTEEKDR